MPEKNPSWRKRRAEKKYWEKETEQFRKQNPAAYLQSRAIERIAKSLIPRINKWRNQRRKAAQQWIGLENTLLSGKKNPEFLAKMLFEMHKSGLAALQSEKDFLQRRADAYGKAFKEIDWDAVDRTFAMQDIVAEIKTEASFYGHLKELANKKLLNEFAELVSRLKISKDPIYRRLRQRAVLAGIGINSQEKMTINAIKEASLQWQEGKITSIDMIRREMLAELALTQQYFELTGNAEYLFKHMKEYATQKELKAFLRELQSEMERRKKFYAAEKREMERQIRKTPGL